MADAEPSSDVVVFLSVAAVPSDDDDDDDDDDDEDEEADDAAAAPAMGMTPRSMSFRTFRILRTSDRPTQRASICSTRVRARLARSAF